MATTKTTFTITVEHDSDHDADTIGAAVDTLLETALSTPGVLDDLGNPDVGETDLQLTSLLTEPDVDDAHHILREVYRHMGLPLPSFLEE